jgi:putative flippase GtrA
MQVKLLVPTNLTSPDYVVGQFLRYVVVGGVAFVVDFTVLVLLTEVLGLHYLTSAAIAFCCGLVTNYILSITWVFSTRSLASKRTEFTIFSIIGVVGVWAGMNYSCTSEQTLWGWTIGCRSSSRWR